MWTCKCDFYELGVQKMKCLWIDCETTGLNAKNNFMLEIVVMEADFDDSLKILKVHQHIIHHDGTGLNDYIKKMHGPSGLLQECLDSKLTTLDVQRLLCEQLSKDEIYVVAGSSIGFDMDFLYHHMPELTKNLAYRKSYMSADACYVQKLDVSVIKMFCRTMGMPEIKKKLVHRATDDILESIDHLKQCNEWLKKHYSGEHIDIYESTEND